MNAVKSGLLETLRIVARSYIEHAPWLLGKTTAYEAFEKYFAWRPYRGIIRTRFGDQMDVVLPDLVPEVICGTGQWEPAITHYIRANLAPGDTFIDAGANIGWYTLLASRLVGAAGTVIAIEASPSIYRTLLHNIELNECRNVTALHAAAAGAPGKLAMYYNNIGSSGRSTTVEEFARANAMKFEADVPADTLVALAGVETLRNARFIKVDVEGAERTVLEPLFESLKDFSSRTEWLLELVPLARKGAQDDVDAIYEAFVRAGYTCYGIPGGYRPEDFVREGRQMCLERLQSAPTKQCDVLMTRRTPTGMRVR